MCHPQLRTALKPFAGWPSGKSSEKVSTQKLRKVTIPSTCTHSLGKEISDRRDHVAHKGRFVRTRLFEDSSVEQAERAYSGAPLSTEIAVDAHPTCSYKGFDVYPLIYLFDTPREWHERRPDRAYSASVLICQEGEPPDTERSRIFPLLTTQWESIGTAKRAAAKMAEGIIDGFVPGQFMRSA